MVPYLIAGVAGMYIAGRNAPKTKLQKMQCFGPRTGSVYEVEVIPGVGVVIVHAKDGTIGIFQQNEAGRFLWLRGKGAAETAKGMRLDLEP